METQDTAELLSQLKGVHLPDAPVAPSLLPVYLSILLCVVALIAFILKINRNDNNEYDEALSTLSRIRKDSTANELQKTAALLKRIALTHDARPAVRLLHGNPWLEYLDNFYQTDFFSQGKGRIFGDALYQPDTALDKNIYQELQRLIKYRKRFQ